MSINSYAQNFEDVMLWRALGQIEHGFYIDIGAQDPIIDSVSLAFHEHGWRGIHVEPTPHYAELLRQQRPGDTVIQAAVGKGPASLRFFEIPDTGISSAEPVIAQQHRERGFNVHEITVTCIALSAVFKKCAGSEIHWLKIDVEGFEKQVLSSWGKSKARPWVVVVESLLPFTQIENHESWETILIKYGYTPAYFDGLNRYYVSDAHPELKDAFRAPPNIFDGFTLNGTASATFHHLIDARYKEKINEILAQNEQQKQSATNEIERLTLSLTTLDKTHAEQEQKRAQREQEVSAQLLAIQHQHAEREQSLSLQLQTGQEELRRIEQDRVRREQVLSEQTSQTRQELENLLRTQVQREQEVSAQLLAIQQQAAQEMAEQANSHSEQERALQHQHAEREQSLSLQLQTGQEELHRLEQDRAHREKALDKEIVALCREAQALHHAQQLQAQQHSFEISMKQDEHNHHIQSSATLEAELKAQIQTEQKISLQLRQTLAEVQQSLETTHASLTWRMTRPLRSLAALIAPPKNPSVTSPLIREVEPQHAVMTDVIESPTTNEQVSIEAISHPSAQATNPNTPTRSPRTGRNVGRALPMKNIPYAELASFNGEQFVENCYLRLLHRQTDPSGRTHYLSQLKAGVDKATIIGDILRSNEGRRVGEQVGGLWTRSIRKRLEKWPVLGSFLPIHTSDMDKALRAIDNKLHRLIEAYATLAANNLAAPSSEPAVAISPTPKPQPHSIDVCATPEANNLAAPSLEQVVAISPAPKPKSHSPLSKVTLAKQSRPSIFLVVDSTSGLASEGAHVLGHIGKAFLARGESILFVSWNTETRNLQLVTRDDLDHLELAVGVGEMAVVYPLNGENKTVIEPSSCGTGDWLLVPKTLRTTPDRPQLLEMDLILEARRLGLGTAFIFHGAEPLRAKKFAGSNADAHEQYMQALLLSDAIMPVSTLAANDLKAFFVQHQKADSVPLIEEIPIPAEAQGDAARRWSDYVGSVRGILANAGDKSHHLTALYYWIDLAAPPCATGRVFTRRLASALTERGIALIATIWDPKERRLIPADGKCPDHLMHACAPGTWAAWIEPGQADAPQWVFRPDEVGGELLAEVAAFAKSRHLRTATILSEADGQRSNGDSAPPNARDQLLFEALAGIDKVLATSERQFQQFYRFLLSWRGKIHSAEHRFRTIVSPNEIPGQRQRSWSDYAREIAIELATDRLSDGLRPVEAEVEDDVYASLVNLHRRPKLSLCISTYNRAGWVEVNLRNIFTQIPIPRADLEVLVVDNTSTDHTPDVVQQYLDRPDFRYVRNPKNVGMLGNLAVTAQTAKGEYIWILGDDDLTRPGAIVRVLQIIDQHPGIGLIYMNYGYTSEADPGNVTDLTSFLANYNTLEPAGPDECAPVKLLAAKCENFFTAIYSHVYRRDHALKSYCQDTSGRIFSTMLSCVPTAYYVLHYMADEQAYWIGEPSLIANSNVSWQDYGVLLDLEQLPRTWDLAERMGTPPDEVDRRRANRLWLVEMMWKEIFENDKAGNSEYFSASGVLMRLKHLPELDKHIPELISIYERARISHHPAANMPSGQLFSSFGSLTS